ncbi:MAG: 4Fe-4S ferredoxin [Geobacteraceae bacterium GWC2_58_44]|nr:MAG: 4Fe-4S ferredoxin [Geobacteraceae bacterium GWC2_58_44]HBG05715.1 4Fe-4S ferredoxin [Geobacter sp.]
MEKAFLNQARLGEFLGILRLFGELHGPTVSHDGVAAFAALGDASALRLDYGRTQIPPKKYLIPFREELLQYRDGSYQESQTNAPDMVLFGLHPCDLDGIAYLDLVFLGDRPDPCYAARRAALTLIGISCEPDDFCFCNDSLETTACDLFLTSRGEGFEVAVLSARGGSIASAAKALLTRSQSALLPTRDASCPIPPQDPQLRFSGNPLWDSFAERCVSCGACSVCCPTCYCFDVREYPGLGGGGTRLREWDNCLFVTHGEVAGANFRGTRLERLRYRFLHKYCGFSPLEGMTSCVGCGRCKKVCPVQIDLRELIETGRQPAAELP